MWLIAPRNEIPHWRGACFASHRDLGLENNAQEHQRVADEQVETGAALATNRAAAHMTSRISDMMNNVEANFSRPHRGLLFEITFESAQTLDAQPHSLVQEVNFHIIIVVLKVNPMNSTNLKAELRHNLERSNADSAQLRNLCEETRTANARIAPEPVHNLEKLNFSPEPRRCRSQETELQLQNLHQDQARINDLMKLIQITGGSMNIRDQGLVQQMQTSNFELSRSQTEASYLRTSVWRNQSTEHRDAEHLRIWTGENNTMGRENIRHSAETER